MLLVFVILLAILAATVQNFTSAENIKGLLMSVFMVGMIACTMLFCLAAGDFDLSVGSTFALAGVLSALIISKTGSFFYAISAGIAAGALVGLVNGFVIAKIGINALITTLATMQIVRGVALLATDATSIGIFDASFGKLGKSQFLGIQSPVWIMILSFIVFGLLLNKTVFGRNTLAIGGNAEAACLAGVKVARSKIVIFMLQGMMAAFAGIVLASYVTTAQPNVGQGLELQVISACVLGGVSLTGGIGTISGMIVGVLIMGTVQNAMNLKNIEPFWQLVVSGLILLAAVMLDKLKTKGV
ncbi:MAG: L-arabinose ABC transporter permease AraH [Armatimonadetes bacterium]|nr:L-arabinose ABC transporter permease AraH [Armatimonadota bacterium]